MSFSRFSLGEKITLQYEGFSERVEYWGKSPFTPNSIVVEDSKGMKKTISLNGVILKKHRPNS